MLSYSNWCLRQTCLCDWFVPQIFWNLQRKYACDWFDFQQFVSEAGIFTFWSQLLFLILNCWQDMSLLLVVYPDFFCFFQKGCWCERVSVSAISIFFYTKDDNVRDWLRHNKSGVLGRGSMCVMCVVIIMLVFGVWRRGVLEYSQVKELCKNVEQWTQGLIFEKNGTKKQSEVCIWHTKIQ